MHTTALPDLLRQKEAEFDRLREENSRQRQENSLLLAQLARLGDEVSRLQTELASARQSNAELHRKVDELLASMAKSNERISELLAMALRKKGSPAAAPKPPEAPPSVPDAVRATYEGRPQPPTPPGPLYDHPKPRPSPTGRKPLPSHLETVTTTVRPERCLCGCQVFDWVDEVVEEKLDVRAHQRRRHTIRQTGRCRACGVRTTAEAPPSPFERSKVTCEWLAWFVAQKFALMVPLDRLRRYLGAQGVALSMSFLVSQTEAAADLLSAIDGEHWRTLVGGAWLATDGTGLKVQVPGAGLHHGFVEVYHRDDVVVFQYEAEKGGETQSGKLGRFKGILLVDAESRYNKTFRDHPGILEANCNAHPRRKLRDAEASQPVLAAEGGRFIGAMFGAEEEARTLGLTGEALRVWRRERCKPLFDQFRVWMDAVEPTLTPSDPLAKVIRYYRNHWDALRQFLDHPDIPIDNSGSEREFQRVAKLRLNSLFAGGTEGAHRACVLLGIAATCRRLGVDLEAYLTWVFIRRGTHRAKYNLSPAQLTPAEYRRLHRPAT